MHGGLAGLRRDEVFDNGVAVALKVSGGLLDFEQQRSLHHIEAKFIEKWSLSKSISRRKLTPVTAATVPLQFVAAANFGFCESATVSLWQECDRFAVASRGRVDNNYLVLSMERLLQHRRNKALESLESSCNLPAPLFRMSAGVDYSGPLTMRLSDMSAYEGHCPRKSREPKAPRANSIRSNLQELEEKLNKARTLLETSNSQKHVLAAGKRDSANNLLGVHQLRLFTCNEEDESTLNLDSHAFFKMAPSNAKRAKDYYVRTLINSLAGSNPSAKKHLQDTMFAMRSVLSLPLPSIFEL